MASQIHFGTFATATKEAQERVCVTDEEKAKWQDIVDNMYLPEDKERGIFLQQDDFLDKDIRPVSEIEDQRPINQHWSWDKILRSPFIKQADVLQGIYFLNDEYTMEQKEKNFDFYEPLTVHESSLSPCIHSILAAELGKQKKAVELYQRTARLDLDNYNNDTVDGLHITSMSGSWLTIVQGFAGMRYDHNQLKLTHLFLKVGITTASRSTTVVAWSKFMLIMKELSLLCLRVKILMY